MFSTVCYWWVFKPLNNTAILSCILITLTMALHMKNYHIRYYQVGATQSVGLAQSYFLHPDSLVIQCWVHATILLLPFNMFHKLSVIANNCHLANNVSGFNKASCNNCMLFFLSWLIYRTNDLVFLYILFCSISLILCILLVYIFLILAFWISDTYIWFFCLLANLFSLNIYLRGQFQISHDNYLLLANPYPFWAVAYLPWPRPSFTNPTILTAFHNLSWVHHLLCHCLVYHLIYLS